MAILKTAETELAKQREMIEGLILRVSQHGARADLQGEIPPSTHTADDQPIDFMKTVVLDAAPTLQKPAPVPAPKPAAPAPKPAAPAQPLVSDDLMAEIGGKPAFDPMKTQKLDSGFDPMKTQKLDATKMEETQILDRARMEETQILDAKKMETTAILDGNPASNAEVTQRLDDSIWRLQEARRILQKVPKT